MELRPPLHLDVVAIEKGAFGSSLTKVANFTYNLSIYLSIFGVFTFMYIQNTFVVCKNLQINNR